MQAPKRYIESNTAGPSAPLSGAYGSVFYFGIMLPSYRKPYRDVPGQLALLRGRGMAVDVPALTSNASATTASAAIGTRFGRAG